jgi:hypothetical protein
MAKPVDPSVVGTSTSSAATSFPFQRKSFYANGRFWVFYSDGTNMVYRTSTDGSTWSAATTVRAAASGTDFSIWFDGTYLHYAYAAATSIYYRRGTPNSDGTITWSADEQRVSTTYNGVYYPMISVDSNGYVWVGYNESPNPYTTYPYVIKSGNNDGTWGTTPSGFPYQLSTTSSSYWRVSVIPLTSGKMLVIYAYDGATVKARRWDGSAWGTEVTTTSAIYAGKYHSAVAQGDDVHLVFLKSTGYDILYTKYSYSSNSFGTETTLVAGATSTSAPVMSIDPSTNDLYVFAATTTTGTPSGWTANHIYYIKYTASTGTWGSWTDWIAETETLTVSDRLTCFYQSYGNYIGLEYMTKTTSPYNVKFAYLQLAVAVTVTVTDSVGLSDAALCNKAFAVSDSASLSDAVLCHKTFAVTDSVGLTETLIGLPAASKIIIDAVGLTDVVSVYVAAVLKIVEDSIGLSDAVYRNKSLIISDAVSLVDQVLRHKPLLPVSDVLTLAEVVAVSKLLAVSDSVSLSDVAKVFKQLRVSDSITLVDAAQVPSKILAVLDSIGLSDAAKVYKALIVSDQIALVEVVYAAPVRRTKLFLVIGNLAIQLTGG